MNLESTCPEPPGSTRVISVTISELDLVRSDVPKAIRQWYESLKTKRISDELFYLSEIAKGLEPKECPRCKQRLDAKVKA